MTRVNGPSQESLFMRKFTFLFLIVFSMIFTVKLMAEEKTPAVVYDLEYAKISFYRDGSCLLHWKDQTPWSEDHLPVFRLKTQEGRWLTPRSVQGDQDGLSLLFEEETFISFHVTKGKGFLFFDLDQFEPKQKFKEFQILRMPVPRASVYAPLTNTAIYQGKSLSLMTAAPNVHPVYRPMPGLPGNRDGKEPVQLETVDRFGLAPVRCGLLASPSDQWPEIVPEFQKAAQIPSPRPGGVWNKLSPWTRKSYLFLTCFKESEFE